MNTTELLHIALYDTEGHHLGFLHVETFELTAISSMPDKYLFTGMIGKIETINSVMISKVYDLRDKTYFNLSDYVKRVIA